MQRVEILNPVVGLCYMQVCVEQGATDEEILAICNKENPSGTTNGWTTIIRENGLSHQVPVPCADNPERLHVLVSC